MLDDEIRFEGEGDMLNNLLDFTRGLDACQTRRAMEMMKVPVIHELRGPDEEPGSCPRCGCGRIVKKGLQRGENGEATQRSECKNCDRTFNKRTNGVLTQSKLAAWQWVRFVELMFRNAPLSECETACHVSEPTAHFMRLRLCQVMRNAVPAFTCGKGERLEIDGTYLNESFAGTGRRGVCVMPREAHKSGNDVRSRGISDMKVCVLCGASESGDIFVELCDRGRPTDKALEATLNGKVEGADVVTDALPGYERVLPRLGVGAHEAHKAGGVELARVNSLHKRLKDFLRPFNGVSTRYLDHYCWWFVYLEWVRRAGANRLDSMFELAATGRYFLTRSAIEARQRPFWDYWEGRSPEIDAVSLYGDGAA